MSEHHATVTWQRDGSAFIDQRYSRRHQWLFDGGAEVLASSSPAVVPPPLSDAAAVDPEEAFVASLSSCHMLWFLFHAARRGLVVESYRDAAVGVMAKDAAGKFVMSHVTLRPVVRFGDKAPSTDVLHTLHHRAHEDCYLARSVKAEVLCEPADSLKPTEPPCSPTSPSS